MFGARLEPYKTMELSLWDVEKAEAKVKKKLDIVKNVVGRDTKLPKKLEGKQIGISKIENPEAILFKIGYIKLHNNGYIRIIDKNFRFHAFITVDRKHIYLHSDSTENGRHVSSSKGTGDEKSWIKNEILKQIPNYVHEEGLTQEQILEAIKNLKEENEKERNKK